MESAERFTGCMLGGAVGDALGYLIEDMDLKTIHKKIWAVWAAHDFKTSV